MLSGGAGQERAPGRYAHHDAGLGHFAGRGGDAAEVDRCRWCHRQLTHDVHPQRHAPRLALPGLVRRNADSPLRTWADHGALKKRGTRVVDPRAPEILRPKQNDYWQSAALNVTVPSPRYD